MQLRFGATWSTGGPHQVATSRARLDCDLVDGSEHKLLGWSVPRVLNELGEQTGEEKPEPYWHGSVHPNGNG
jgi:hypothetical protein